MIAITLVFTVLFVLMSLIVGGLAGWVYREYIWSQRPENIHPEMFDENGNLMPDEIIAFRFEEVEEEETED